jgi:hypothetical protein
MKKQAVIFSFSVMFFAGMLLCIFPKQQAVSSKNFALVEYFTSDACYRCPPADEVVKQMQRDYADKNVFVLAYHVDYRNDSLWSDPFSQSSFSERQRRYGRRFRLYSVYTPQVIINGKKEVVGSDKALLYSSLQAAVKDTATSQVSIMGTKRKDDSLIITFRANAYKENILNVALVQNSFQQKIEKGANRGKTLQHQNIVRELSAIPFIGKKEGTAMLAIPSGLSLNDISIVAFVQNRGTLTVTSATAISPAD